MIKLALSINYPDKQIFRLKAFLIEIFRILLKDLIFYSSREFYYKRNILKRS